MVGVDALGLPLAAPLWVRHPALGRDPYSFFITPGSIYDILPQKSDSFYCYDCFQLEVLRNVGP